MDFYLGGISTYSNYSVPSPRRRYKGDLRERKGYIIVV